MKELAGKTAFVTGAASGIGLGIATALAQAGAIAEADPAALKMADDLFRLQCAPFCPDFF